MTVATLLAWWEATHAALLGPQACHLRTPGETFLYMVGNRLICLAYLLLAWELWHHLRHRWGRLHWRLLGGLGFFGLFILSCGLGHAIAYHTLRWATFRFEAGWHLWTATVSLFTAIMLRQSRAALHALRTPHELETLNRDLAASVAHLAERLALLEANRAIEGRDRVDVR